MRIPSGGIDSSAVAVAVAIVVAVVDIVASNGEDIVVCVASAAFGTFVVAVIVVDAFVAKIAVGASVGVEVVGAASFAAVVGIGVTADVVDVVCVDVAVVAVSSAVETSVAFVEEIVGQLLE